jgi:hypothetical protein
MGRPTFDADMLRRLARDFYDYSIPEDAAAAVAKVASALLDDLRGLAGIDLDEVAPAFSYATMRADADRLRSALNSPSRI